MYMMTPVKGASPRGIFGRQNSDVVFWGTFSPPPIPTPEQSPRWSHQLDLSQETEGLIWLSWPPRWYLIILPISLPPHPPCCVCWAEQVHIPRAKGPPDDALISTGAACDHDQRTIALMPFPSARRKDLDERMLQCCAWFYGKADLVVIARILELSK